MKLNVAVYNGNVQAFKFQSTNCEVVEVEVSPDFINEPIFTESNQNRFKVVDGVVVKKTEEELKSEPEYNVWIASKRADAYKNESDPMFFKYQRGELTEIEWLDKVQEIKNRYPKN